ncbi:unnamed protein product [Lampetra planeri]
MIPRSGSDALHLPCPASRKIHDSSRRFRYVPNSIWSATLGFCGSQCPDSVLLIADPSQLVATTVTSSTAPSSDRLRLLLVIIKAHSSGVIPHPRALGGLPHRRLSSRRSLDTISRFHPITSSSSPSSPSSLIAVCSHPTLLIASITTQGHARRTSDTPAG